MTRDGRYAAMGGPGVVAPVSLFRRTSGGGYAVVDDLEFGPSFYAAAPPEYGDPWTVWVNDSLDYRVFVYRLDGAEGPQLVTEWTTVVGGSSGDTDPQWRWFVAGDYQSIRVYDIADWLVAHRAPTAARGGEVPWTLRNPLRPDRRTAARLSPSGSSQLYDTATWTFVDDDVVCASPTSPLGYWSDDGSLIATAAADGQITIRHGDTFEPIREMVGAVGSSNTWAEGALLLSADKSLLLTNHDGAARLWDVATGQQIGVEFPNAEQTIPGVNFGQTLQLVTGANESALVWNLDTTEWAEIACRVAGSNLTRDEWAQWGPRDEDYRSICDQYPIET